MKGKMLYIKWMNRLAGLLARLGLLQPGKIMYIGGSDTLPAPLDRAEEAELIARLEKDYPDLKSKVMGAMERAGIAHWDAV